MRGQIVQSNNEFVWFYSQNAIGRNMRRKLRLAGKPGKICEKSKAGIDDLPGLAGQEQNRGRERYTNYLRVVNYHMQKCGLISNVLI